MCCRVGANAGVKFRCRTSALLTVAEQSVYDHATEAFINTERLTGVEEGILEMRSFVFGSRARMVVLLGSILVAALVLAACGSSSSSSSSTSSNATSSNAANAGSTKHLKIAYLSFAVANSYDAPMLAAAQAVAASNNASMTVFDANNDPNKQFSQLQNALTTGGYDGVITQPIESTNLIPLVQQAIGKKVGSRTSTRSSVRSSTRSPSRFRGSRST